MFIFLSRLFVRVIFVLAKPDFQSSNRILGSQRGRAENRATQVPVSEIHRRRFAPGPHIVRLHGGVAQLHLHRYKHYQSDLGGKRNENEGVYDNLTSIVLTIELARRI